MARSLRELEAYLVKHEVMIAEKGHGRPLPDGTIQWGGFEVDGFRHVETLAEADGIFFLCPKCFEENRGSVGTHGVRVFFHGRHAPDRVCTNKHGQVVRWNLAGGTGLDDLVLTPSILLFSTCAWHGFVGSNGVPPGHAA